MAHLRVAQRSIAEHQGRLTAQADAATKPLFGVDDPRVQDLFGSHERDFRANEVQMLPSAYLLDLPNPREGFAPIRERKTGLEVLWASKPEDLGDLAVDVQHYWMPGSVGMVLWREAERARALGAIMMTGLARNSWNAIKQGGYFCLGGVMCEGGIALGDLVDKANDMIKWEVINRILGRDTELGPGKSLVLAGQYKFASLALHGVVERFLGSYIGGNDEGVGPDEAALLSALAQFNFAGNAVAERRMRGRFPSPYTAGGVNQFLLRTLQDHVGDLRAPIAFQGFGGVGSTLIELAIQQGLNIAGIIEGDVNALRRAARLLKEKGGMSDVPLILDVDGTRLLCKGDGAKVDAQIREAEAANFTIVSQGGLAACLRELKRLGRKPVVGSPNAHAHVITQEVLDTAKELEMAAFIGGANNPFQFQHLAAIAVAMNILVSWGPMANPLGAQVVLADALGMTPFEIEMSTLRLNDLFDRSLAAHRRGVSPLEDGQEMVAESWNPKLLDGRAIGPRYGKS